VKGNEINIPATKVFLETWNAIQTKQYKLICQEGSSRSSKTWSDFQVLFKYSQGNFNKVINVLRDTATDCRDIIEPEWVKWLSDPCNRTKQFEEGKLTAPEYSALLKREDLRQLYNENKTKHIWTSKTTGSTIRFTGLDDEDKVMGMTQDVCWVNEPYAFAHEVYKQLSQRTGDFILIDWNPKKKHWIDTEKAKETSIVLKSTFKDNPFCPQKAKDQILSYQPVSLCDAVTKGLISERDAAAYDFIENPLSLSPRMIKELSRCLQNEQERSASKYHWEVFGLGLHSELPNRIYRWTPISPSDYYAIKTSTYYYSDWGSVDPWAVGEVKYYDGALYVRELNYASENELRSKLSATELQQIAGADEGLVTWVFNRLGISQSRPVICDTNRPNKIIALRNAGYDYAVGLTRRETGATKSEKVDGIDLLNNLKVYYTSDSENIEFEQETYSRKLDSNGQVTDEPEDGGDHHCDGIRYVALFLQSQGIIQKI
jgi:hypothetical protein